MKLFSFFKKATLPADKPPVDIAPVLPDSHPSTFEPVQDLVMLLILKVVESFPNRGSEQNLQRFFAKTSIPPATILQRKQDLLREELLAPTAVKQSVQYFSVTEKGKTLLAAHFDVESMLAFAREIEPKGFIATLLRNVEEKEKRPA